MALSVFHPDPAALHPPYLPRSVPQKEDIPSHAFDGKVLIHGADKSVLRVGDDVIVGVVGDGPAAGKGGYARAAAALQDIVDAVPVQESTVAALPWGEPLGKDGDDLIVLVPGQVPVRVGAAAHLEQPVFAPILR